MRRAVKTCDIDFHRRNRWSTTTRTQRLPLGQAESVSLGLPD